jgi:hypothetical protein
VQSQPNEPLDFDKDNKINGLKNMPESWAAMSGTKIFLS